jgi:hypothetical protein
MKLIPALLCSVLMTLVTAPALAQQDDGPHARYVNQGIEARWLCEGKSIQKNYTAIIGSTIDPVCAFPASIVIDENSSAYSVTAKYQAKKIAALSDIHGQYGSLKTLLQAHGIIGSDLNWTFGDGHLVIAGDIVDRGAQVTEALWLLYRLDAQSKAAGGRLHVLLGNHETMIMANDLRYVNQKYVAVAREFGVSYPELFGADTVLGRWLRSKPVIVQINDSLFMHAGLHPDYLKLKLSLTEVNQQFASTLGLAKSDIKKQDHLSFLYGSLGPIWYRGYFKTPQLPLDELDQLLQQLAVKRIVVGHTTMSGILSHYQGKIFSIDSDIKSGKSGEILLIENDLWRRGTLQGEKLAIPENTPQTTLHN